MTKVRSAIVATLLLSALTLVLSPTSAFAGTPTFVQVASATPQTPQSTVSKAFISNQVAGDTDIVVVGWNDTTSTVSTVSDSKGNTYALAVATFRGNGVSQAVYYAQNVAAGSDTVTVHFNQSAAFVDLRITEYANVGAFDAGASGQGTGGTASSGNATTTHASDLLVGAGITTGGFTAAGTGYTKRVITSDLDIVEDRNVSAVGAYAATAPVTGSWVMQVAAFAATTTGGTLINCWPAPAANCGFPDATNTGVPAGTTLSAYTGPATITTANTVIDSKDVATCLTIATTGVVIKNSHLHGNCFYVVYSHTGNSVTVQDSELDCANNVSTTALGDTGVTALRDNIHGCENGFDIDVNITVKDSYIHDLPSTDQAHTDGLQLAATLGQGVLVEHNTVTAKNNAGVNGTSAMIMNTSGASNVTLDNNLLDGGAFTVYCPTAADTNVQVYNNRFGRSAAFGQWTDCQDETRHDGNVYDDNNAPLV